MALADLDRWRRGETVPLEALTMSELVVGVHLVFEEAFYYQVRCRVAGKLIDIGLEGGSFLLKLQSTGTDSDALLKHCSDPGKRGIRVLRCPHDCGHDLVAEDLLHGVRVRQARAVGLEEGWVNNLIEVTAELPDELEELRKRQAGLAPAVPGAEKAKARSISSEESGRKKKKKGKKKKEKKKDQKEKAPSKAKETGTEEKSREAVALDGSQPRLACVKEAKHLFQGTGLDPRERVRSRVLRKARRYASRKTDRSTSSSASSSSESNEKDEELAQMPENIFEQSSKIRRISGAFPGALTTQALTSMRESLLQELGEEETRGPLKPVATLFFRQVLQKKASGPTSRELQTLSALVDTLLRCKPAAALDIAIQRMKSIESTLGGSHWQISQRLEILPTEGSNLTAGPELEDARKHVYAEAKVRNMSTTSDGRRPPKGGGKGKSEGKHEGKKGNEAKGKGGGQKTEGRK